MERLTVKGFEFTSNYVASKLQSWSIAECLKKLQSYEDLEERCIKENAIGIKLLIEKWKEFMEDIAELAEYRKLKEQGLLLRLPMTVEDVISRLFSHNEIIALWKEVKEEVSYHEIIWRGMAWDIPKEYKDCEFVKLFGTIPESIAQADTINIEIVLSAEAEAALEKMKGEEHETD